MMTETEWSLRRENLQLKMMLAEARSQVLNLEHQQFKAELAALGEQWNPTTALRAVEEHA